MTEATRQDELRTQLETFGDPRKTWQWHEGDPDYVAALNLTPDDVPQLLAVTRQWLEPIDGLEDESESEADARDDVSVYAPIHAWRSLAQLRAAETVAVLLEILGPMDERMDDWRLEEFPHAFALIGPAALEPLSAYLREPTHPEYARICVAHSLQEIASAHEQQREHVVSVLAGQLEHFADQPESLNAFLISYLMNLQATEAADVIERAFAVDAVELRIVGNWDTVRKDLGVKGRGLVPHALASQRMPSLLPPLRRDQSPASPAPDALSSPPASRRNERRLQRKRERRNRKRGRRR